MSELYGGETETETETRKPSPSSMAEMSGGRLAPDGPVLVASSLHQWA